MENRLLSNYLICTGPGRTQAGAMARSTRSRETTFTVFGAQLHAIEMDPPRGTPARCDGFVHRLTMCR